MLKHVFFDLDKTLTMSRSPMTPQHQEIFDTLCITHDVVVISGGSAVQIREQVTPRFDGKYFTLAQSGNHAIGKDQLVLWEERLDAKQTTAVMQFVELLKKHFAIKVRDEDDLVEHRGAQISYSVIGFHESSEKKYAFDPDDKRRASALAALSEEREMLVEKGVDVVPAGTTTFNFTPAGKHKGYNIARFLEKMGWSKDECLYIGDALFPGGNDESVIGIIPTHAVKNPDDTFRFIERELIS